MATIIQNSFFTLPKRSANQFINLTQIKLAKQNEWAAAERERIEQQSRKDHEFTPFKILANILLFGVAIATSIATAGASIAVVGATDFTVAALDAGVNTFFDIEDTGKINITNIVLPFVGAAVGVGGLALAGKTTKSIEHAISGTESAFLKEGLNENQATASALSMIDVASGSSAESVSIKLQRAGFTDKEVVKQLSILRDQAALNGIKNQGFINEVDFIKQESQIFGEFYNKLESIGVNINKLFDNLAEGGIDVKGISTTQEFIRQAKTSPKIASVLRGEGLIETSEEILGKSLEPNFARQIINAQNIEKIARTANKYIKLIEPNRLIKAITKKLFKPVEHFVDEKVWEKVEKRTLQKVKQTLRQDIAIKKETKNGVYPCFGSSWINYLRAVPYGNGVFKCFVIFRKRGQQPVLITPPLDLDYIINWSQSISPGTIYHEFRRKYGGIKGAGKITLANFGADLSRISNLLGFIPSKYIRLGTSLIGNIFTAYTVLSTAKFSEFFEGKEASKAILENVIDESSKAIGGKFGNSIVKQAMGDNKAIGNFVAGKIIRYERRHQSSEQRAGRRGRSSARSLLRVKNITNKF